MGLSTHWLAQELGVEADWARLDHSTHITLIGARAKRRLGWDVLQHQLARAKAGTEGKACQVGLQCPLARGRPGVGSRSGLGTWRTLLLGCISYCGQQYVQMF